MSRIVRPVVVFSAAALFALLICPAASQAQVVVAYSPTASCGVTACSPVVVNTYRPMYRPLFGGNPWRNWWRRNTLYRPVVAAQPVLAGYSSGCNTCASPCTTCASPCTTCYTPRRCCRYVPQTCYRTVYCNVPITTYRAVTTCDPCTGCARTCMKPCVTYCRQARRVPYTTYRMVCETRYTATTSCPTNCCNGCDTGGCAVGCGAGGCATGACGINIGQTNIGQTNIGQTTEQPTLDSNMTKALKPEPEKNGQERPTLNPQSHQLRDLDAEPALRSDDRYRDKTASLDNRAVRRISLTVPKAPATKPINDGGWRASRR